METPTPVNPLGAKGIGESGTIGATPAVHNAVIDALSHLGVRHLDMPLNGRACGGPFKRPGPRRRADVLRLLTVLSLTARASSARVSRFLFESGANIVRSDQYSSDPEGGTFFLRMEFTLAPEQRDGSGGAVRPQGGGAAWHDLAPLGLRAAQADGDARLAI